MCLWISDLLIQQLPCHPLSGFLRGISNSHEPNWKPWCPQCHLLSLPFSHISQWQMCFSSCLYPNPRCHPWFLSYSSHSIHRQIPVATLFNFSQVWQPSVPPAQAWPPLHLTWTTGSISYMIAPNPHLALPQLTLCSTTRQIPFKCQDISLLLCLNFSSCSKQNPKSTPCPHTCCDVGSVPPTLTPTFSSANALQSHWPSYHFPNPPSTAQALVILFPLPEQSSPKYTRSLLIPFWVSAKMSPCRTAVQK